MKNLLFIFLLFSCTIDETITPNNSHSSDLRIKSESTPITKLYIMLGQSNCGYANPALFTYKATKGVKGWDPVNLKWVDSLSTRQVLNKSYSPLIPISGHLKEREPFNNLYFMVWHKSGSTLWSDWNPKHTSGLNLFNKACTQIDKAILQMATPPDSVFLIWMQGEGDVSSMKMAKDYQWREAFLFDTLNTRYQIDRYINYIPQTSSVNTQYLIQSKEINASLNPKISLVYVPKTPQYYELPHLTKDGIIYFAEAAADSILQH